MALCPYRAILRTGHSCGPDGCTFFVSNEAEEVHMMSRSEYEQEELERKTNELTSEMVLRMSTWTSAVVVESTRSTAGALSGNERSCAVQTS